MSFARTVLIQASLFRSLAFFMKDKTNATEGTPNLSTSEINSKLESDSEFATKAAEEMLADLQATIEKLKAGEPAEPVTTEEAQPAEPAKTEETQPAEPVKTEEAAGT